MKVKDIISIVSMDTEDSVKVWEKGEMIFSYKYGEKIPPEILDKTVKTVSIGYFCIGLDV